ncbi:MAG: hypothetical protein JXB13_13390 [Phycisphaerae bacterium]|nr:hypothetical protein [Phycisphaerae bacterium]
MKHRAICVCGLAGVFAIIAALTGCAAGPAPEGAQGPPTNGNTPGENTNSSLPGDASVLVRFVNETNSVVEVQFHATLDDIGSSEESLFAPQYLVIDGIGVAGTGLLIPRSADTIEWHCSDGLVIGVAGGRFLDPDSGAELGTGTPRMVQQGLVFDCGATITFTYQETGYGYTVSVSHE